MDKRDEVVAHRERMLADLVLLARAKYNRGYEEHGGDLIHKSIRELLLEIREEAIDAFIYAQTAIDKIGE